MLKVTTQSGAIYYVDGDNKVTGGSKDIVNGKLVGGQPTLGVGLMILTPERGHLNPQFKTPGVYSTDVMIIEEVDGSTD